MAEKDEKAKAAAKRRQAEEGYTDAERKEQVLAALAAERQGYVNRDLPERVKQVDEQIKAFKARA